MAKAKELTLGTALEVPQLHQSHPPAYPLAQVFVCSHSMLFYWLYYVALLLALKLFEFFCRKRDYIPLWH